MAQAEEFRRIPDSPVYDEQIKVTSPAQEPPPAQEPSWWQRILEFFGA
jgi:hypothetical protein